MKHYNWLVTFEGFGEIEINTIVDDPHHAFVAAEQLLPEVAEHHEVTNIQMIAKGEQR